MREDILKDVLQRLQATFKFKKVGLWLQQGTCPQCGRKELFTSAETPWVVKCGRENKCGYNASTRDLFPDAFGKFNERFPATTQDPNATADAYMSAVRGFSPAKIKGWYRQGSFSHPRGNRTTATVVFDVGGPAGAVMERLIETVRIREDDGSTTERKAHFVGPHKGLWWQPPGMTVSKGDEIWLVEGCLDAIALHMAGLKAVATLSASNYPGEALAALPTKNVTLVWALDNDVAGKRAIRKHIEQAHQDGFENRCALIPQKGRKKADWNDLWLDNALSEKNREKTLSRCRFHGDLLLAPSAMQKGMLIWQRFKSKAFAVDYAGKTYWWDLPDEVFAANLKAIQDGGQAHPELTPEEEAAQKSAKVHVIANCRFEFLYFQQNKLTDESWYYTRIEFPHGRHKLKNTFSGAQVATASEFKKRLLSIAPGGLFTGNTQQLNWLVNHHLDDIRIVDTVDFIGYSKEYRTYVFPSLAVSAGQVFPLNDEDFFEVGKLAVKSLNSSLHLHIGSRQDYQPDWVGNLYRAYGAKGLVAVAFFFGSLFAEQIRQTHKSFPFLEIVGEAGAGKSTLIEFLWKLVGRSDYEGFDPNKSTLAARARIMSQVANLPVSLIESDRSEDTAKARQFDWDELKTAYNGRASRARGVNNGGNETNEPPFRGSILVSQNNAVQASEAIMQRIIHMNFDTSGHTQASRAAADALAAMPVESVSHFLVMATTAEQNVMEALKRDTARFEAELLALPEVRSQRIAKNHAQFMALVASLAKLVALPDAWRDETLQCLRTAAGERQRAIGADHPLVEEFWELIDYLGEDRTNHSRNRETIAINLNHIQRLAAMNNQTMPTLQDIKKHMKASRSRRFLGIKTVNSGLECEGGQARSVKCWVFERER
ncbi:MAG: hypothetical protein VR70_12120 [Rhodospirillaceae bacterium BRH_c57]|nr:MAG: hypothetical protein VR70_12120 [Rhodospirillaceae bacterium BRH_c57]